MNDVMLPWPEPRRPGKAGAEQPQPAPHYEIQRVNADGSTGPVEVLPITRPPWAAKSGRRGFLGAGIASSVAAALLLSGCGDDDSKSPSPSPSDSGSGSPSPTDSNPSSPSPTETDSPTPSSKPPSSTPPTSPTYPTQPAPSDRYPDPVDPTYGTTGGTTVGGGSGGTICTCNKVCTCIPVCQAHELLHVDPVVRRMAETVVVAMGTRELPYLRWAAQEAPGALRTRIEALIEELRAGRRLTPADLADPGCEPYLTSGNPVIAMMAAQVLALRALRGAGLSGATAERAAQALTTGHALHLDRAPAWSR
ncbi:hypothetical protein [Streptomyces smyrnaeus]|uniref:hypothetical protein n=2 Tax=Streptomyces smyrnaeus TaxID=1387713 RepID=UPI0036B1FC4A